MRRTACTLGLLLAFLASVPIRADEAWVSSIVSSDEWEYFPCTDYWITHVCGIVKDFSDPGKLPQVISVGDVVTFNEKNGKLVQYTVRHINFFVFDNDVNSPWGSAKKGDTICTLFTVWFRTGTKDSNYPSRLIVKGCQIAR